MKVDTFYIIIDNRGHILSGPYQAQDYEDAKKRMIEYAVLNKNEPVSLMKRVHTVTSGLTWEDSI